MPVDSVISVLARDFTASGGTGATREHPQYSNLTVTVNRCEYVEWKVSLPRAGKWYLHGQVAAGERRPCTLILNGVKQDGEVFGESTGGWLADTLKWFVHGPYEFQQGENVFRVEFPGWIPHFKEFRFTESMAGVAAASVQARDIVDSGAKVETSAIYSNLIYSNAPNTFLEWSVSLPQAGKWHLHALMAAAESRPGALSINGVKEATPILGEVTGSWYSDTLLWVTWGPYEFKQGDNRVRVEFTRYHPHLRELAFTPGTPPPMRLKSPWEQVPGSGAVKAVTQLRDGTIVGVGMDNQLYRRPALTSPWTLVPGSGSVKAVTQLRDGTVVGVGMDNQLYRRPALASPWTLVPNSGAVKAVTQLRDGTIVGVGMDSLLYTRATLTSPWVQVPSSGAVKAITQLRDGTIVGIGEKNDQLWTRTTLRSPWVNIPNSGDVLGVVELQDGRLLGAGTDNSLWTLELGEPEPSAEARRLAELEAQVQQRDAEFARQLAEQQQREAALAQQLAEQQQTDAALARQFAQQQAKDAVLARQLAEQQARDDALTRQLAEQQQTDAELTRQLAEQQQTDTEVVRQLAEQQQKNATLALQLAEQNNKLADLEASLAKLGPLGDRIAEQDRKIADLQESVQRAADGPAPAVQAETGGSAKGSGTAGGAGGTSDQAELLMVQGQQIINTHAAYVAGLTLLPLGGVDLLATGAVQLRMLARLTALYGHKSQWSDDLGKRLIGIGLADVTGGAVAASLVKFFPLFGIVRTLVAPATMATATSVLGRLFLSHYARGGDLRSFDAEEARRQVKSGVDRRV